ncbi:Sugar phosphate isomerase/epimerase [Amphibacillus marinus]|uniref:Sugar phosphate isomerase/epimerase n=1 Tax=Amphibacillus marinus TaxID=872970 RepID=A0A1H8QGM4_9BACI|nr:sugar phosphate isomerase/epimerase family protein [Amphibacillus marinus]SEO53186.1 Sugar phosphate isomerase/epimerase [Amphibacillus marinus]
MLNIGIRAHDIDSDNLNDLSKQLAVLQISAIQLALKKSIKEWPIKLGSLNTGLAKTIANEFRSDNVDIAVLGCYINMIHPDVEQRQEALAYFKEHIRFARDFHCSIVATETGNIHSQMGYTEDNFTEEAFQLVVESVNELVKEAERFGVIVGIEGGVNHPIYSPEMMHKLITQIPSNHLQVVFDPVNFLTIENYQSQTKMIDQAFELFGERIIIIHAKDFIVKDNHIKVVPVGHGWLDYQYLINKLYPDKPLIPILLENTKEPFITESIAYLKRLFEQIL